MPLFPYNPLSFLLCLALSFSLSRCPDFCPCSFCNRSSAAFASASLAFNVTLF